MFHARMKAQDVKPNCCSEKFSHLLKIPTAPKCQRSASPVQPKLSPSALSYRSSPECSDLFLKLSAMPLGLTLLVVDDNLVSKSHIDL